jgi:hypothetical protein
MFSVSEAALELRENYGFPSGEIAKIKTALMPRIARLRTEWRRIHGDR